MTREEHLNSGHWLSHPRGIALPQSVLNDDIVRQIRINRHGKTTKQWAKELGCHYRTIEKVIYRESWIHVK